jgi:hypothetical protein
LPGAFCWYGPGNLAEVRVRDALIGELPAVVVMLADVVLGLLGRVRRRRLTQDTWMLSQR